MVLHAHGRDDALEPMGRRAREYGGEFDEKRNLWTWKNGSTVRLTYEEPKEGN